MTNPLLILLLSAACAMGQAFTFKDPSIYSKPATVSLTNGLISYWNLNAGLTGFPDIIDGNLHPLKGQDNFVNPVAGVITNFCQTTINTLAYASNSASAFAAGSGVSFTVAGWWRALGDPTSGDGKWCKKWHPSTTSDQQWEMGLSAAGANPALTVRNNAQTLISVTNTATLSTLYFNHIAFGFDSSAQVIWIQVNGNSRSTAACTEVRTGNSEAVIISGGDGGSGLGTGPATDADEIGFWQRSLSSSEVVSLYDFMSGWAYPFDMTRAMQVATDWTNSVVGNGGAAPSFSSKTNVAAFVGSMITNFLYFKMRAVNVFAPDNLTAAITPLSLWNVNLWSNTGFVAGDLTVNGLHGDGTSKWLNMSIAPVPTGLTELVGITYYTSNVTNEPSMMMGANDANYLNAVVIQQNVGGTVWDCPGSGAGRSVWLTNNWGGYISANRTALNLSKVYAANEGLAHAGVFTNTASISTLVNNNQLGCFSNRGGGTPAYGSERLSFAAFHDGLTESESAAFYAAVRALRVGFGGGYGPF